MGGFEHYTKNNGTENVINPITLSMFLSDQDYDIMVYSDEVL